MTDTYTYMTFTQTGLDQSSAAASLVLNVMGMQCWSRIRSVCCAVRSVDNNRYPVWGNSRDCTPRGYDFYLKTPINFFGVPQFVRLHAD